ncbi:MAG: dihydrofolate reductase [Desulfitobacteriia bacterium]|jgi:dihydrofolate reductase
MKAIVCVDKNWGIGYRGELLQRIPEDMGFFKKMTMGKVVVMGRRTFESLPQKKPLLDRVNIVLSQSGKLCEQGIIICASWEQLQQELKKYPSDNIFVIGGEKVYKDLLPFCKEAYVTKIDRVYPADKFFPNLDRTGKWKLIAQSDWKIWEGTRYCFTKYSKEG